MSAPGYDLQSAETRFLLACCLGQKDIDFSHAFDWNALHARAAASGLGPTVYTVLKRSPKDVPAKALRLFQAEYFSAAATNLRMRHSLDSVVAKLTSRGIPVMLLKGAALLATVYRDPALRIMSDVDLLVHRRDLPLALETLADCGMAPLEEHASQQEFYDHHHHHATPYLARDGSLGVELHHDLMPSYDSVRPPLERIWQDGLTSTACGAALMPSPTHLILHQAVHACRSRFSPPLRGINDLSHILNAYGSSIDWEAFVTETIEWKATREIWCYLQLAHRLGLSGFPLSVLDTLAPHCAFRAGEKAALCRFAEFLALRPQPQRLLSEDLQETLMALAIQPAGMPTKTIRAVRILWSGVVHSARAGAPPLPGWMLPFYAALIHPLRWWWRRKA